MSHWSGRKALVTGGASFIGSHIVEQLAAAGARVRVADNFSSGRRENLTDIEGDVEIVDGDLKDSDFARRVCDDQEVVFHLAADHGGRGYVDLHQAACATNMGLDQNIFIGALAAGVDKVVYASSGCIYPLNLQTDPGEELFLTEDMAGPGYDPDGMYGYAKLGGELTLQAMHRDHGLGAASCRYFTVYGPKGVENHAVMAMIARAFIGENPFRVWGTGEQIRNWTYVGDIVSGTIKAAEKIDDGTAVNLGTMERVRVLDAVKMVLEYTGHEAEVVTQPDMPTGPLNRVADNSLAKRLLDWEPEVPFAKGLRQTIDWYYSTKDREAVKEYLEVLLTERPVAVSTGASSSK